MLTAVLLIVALWAVLIVIGFALCGAAGKPTPSPRDKHEPHGGRWS